MSPQERTSIGLDRALIDVLNTQRDELAKEAMVAIIEKVPGSYEIEYIAHKSYAMADAMLVAKYETLEVRK